MSSSMKHLKIEINVFFVVFKTIPVYSNYQKYVMRFIIRCWLLNEKKTYFKCDLMHFAVLQLKVTVIRYYQNRT